MDIKSMTLLEFTAKTASKDAVPGGGSVAALSGAIAASLSSMVASLTIGKKGYEDKQGEMMQLSERTEALRLKLLADIERDCTSFDAYIKALSLPKDSDKEKAARSAALQSALKEASQVPLEVAQTALQIMPLAEKAVLNGNKNAITDGVISAMMARTAVLSALLNVKINLASIKDEQYTKSAWEIVKKLESDAVSMEADIIAKAGL